MRFAFAVIALLASFGPSPAADPTEDWGHLTLSPDGTRIAGRVRDPRDPAKNGVNLFDVATGAVVSIRDRERLTWKSPGELRYGPWDVSLAFGPDGKELFTANFTKHVSVWDAATGKFLRSIAVPDRDAKDAPSNGDRTVHAQKLFPAKGGLTVETDRGGGTYIRGYFHLDTKTDKLTLYPSKEYGDTTSSWSSPDGRFVGMYDLQASVEDECGVYDVTTGEWVFGSRVETNTYVGQVLPSDDGALAAATYWDYSVKNNNGVLLWRAKDNKEVPLADGKGLARSPLVLSFSPDGKVLYVPYEGRVIRWDTATGKRLPPWDLPAKSGSIAFDWPRNRLVISASGKMQVIEMPKQQ